MIRVALVDDHASSREPLAMLLSRELDIAVVGQAASIAEAMTILTDVDVLLVDLNLPDGDGVDLIEPFRRSSPEGSVIVLSGSTDKAHGARAVEAGAIGILNKSVPVTEVVAAIRSANDGETLVPAKELMEMVRSAASERAQATAATAMVSGLTAREREMIQALAEGLSDKDIAARFEISPKTVRAHLTNILWKLGVSSRLQVVNFAIRNGLVDII